MPERSQTRRPGKGRARDGRSLARARALQALYQWQLGGQSGQAIERQFLPRAEDIPEPPEKPPAVEPDTELEDALEMETVDQGMFRELLHGVLDRMEEWDTQISPHLTRSIASLDPVERLILRLGTYELNEHIEIPYRVVINEYVEIAKSFGGEDGYKYINGVLDKVAKGHTLRQAEMKQGARDKRGGAAKRSGDKSGSRD